MNEHKTDELLELIWTQREDSKDSLSEILRITKEEGAEEEIKEMTRGGLVNTLGDRVTLTEKGESRAKGIIRRHRLAERLFTEAFQMEVDESIESNACEFEHILSSEVTESVCTFLGHPPTCPHGRPIPRGTCCEKFHKEMKPLVTPLNELHPGEEGRIVFIAPKNHARLDRLSIMGIIPGSIIRLHQKRPSYVLDIGETTLAVDSEIVKEIYVKRVRSQESGVRTNLKLLVFSLFTLYSSLFTGEALAARPLVTEDAVVAGKGVTQLEIGIDYTKVGDGEGTTLLTSPIHGATEDTEFSLKLPYIFGRPDDPSNAEGWGDVSFIMKHLLVDEVEKVPAFLIRMSLKLPTGDEDKGLGTGDTNVGFLGVLTKNFGASALHLNVGYTFVGDQDEGDDDNEVNYGIAGEYIIGRKTILVGEIYGLYHPDYKAREIERRALLGLTYRIDDSFTIDLAAKRGLEVAGDEYGFIGGVTITF